MSIYYDNIITVTDYNSLRKSVGWNEIIERQAGVGIKNSTYLVAAYDDDKAVGMARLISDGGYVAYIADVVVHPEYQKKGIGKTMVNMILSYIEANLNEEEAACALLMAAKGKEEFYKQFGFQERPNEKLGAGMSQWVTKNN